MSQIERLMRSHGFVLVRKNKHFIWEREGVRIVTASTPSDRRALLNIKAWIKKLGAK